MIQLLLKLGKQALPIINNLPNYYAIKLHSYLRSYITKNLPLIKSSELFIPDLKWQRKLWGLNFQAPIFNAAGMFKNADGYDFVNYQGAGAFLAGTSTYNMRLGNTKNGISLPFVNLPKSNITINYLGLPNIGDKSLSKKVITNNKNLNCPIGLSLMRSPDYNFAESLELLLKSLWLYHEKYEIDFIEINESCPNINHVDSDLIFTIQFINKHFLKHRKRNLPVILKLSNDCNPPLLTTILDELITNNFDGITLGNTSTNYHKIALEVDIKELNLFKYFTNHFNGGVSGKYLNKRSLTLTQIAFAHIQILKPNHEFHIIRCGGVETIDDVKISLQYGASLVEWYTGYFNNFIKYGNNIYKQLLNHD